MAPRITKRSQDRPALAVAGKGIGAIVGVMRAMEGSGVFDLLDPVDDEALVNGPGKASASVGATFAVPTEDTPLQHSGKPPVSLAPTALAAPISGTSLPPEVPATSSLSSQTAVTDLHGTFSKGGSAEKEEEIARDRGKRTNVSGAAEIAGLFAKDPGGNDTTAGGLRVEGTQASAGEDTLPLTAGAGRCVR